MKHRENPRYRSYLRFQQLFLCVCCLTVFTYLIFYTFTQTDMNFKTSNMSRDAFNIVLHMKTAVRKLKNVIISSKIQRKRKLVLCWTSYWSKKSDWLPSTEVLQCPVSDCDVTWNRSLLTQSSAVAFHWRSLNGQDLPEWVQSANVQCPLWILINRESPFHTSRYTLEKMQDKVHWVATYRQDSDLFYPYGKVVKRKDHSYTQPDFDPDGPLVCWLVSNCNTPSKRELFVNELKKHIDVDIYGKCSNATCPYELVKDCYQWLSKKCKFYLSLENSNCRDYTTEKLYNALSTGMVPVVWGNNSNYDHLPPSSYINAANFSSPKELAEYLVVAGKDEHMYLEYFSWRNNYVVEDYNFKWYCDLCEKLLNTDIRTVKPRNFLIPWWYDQSECMS